MNTSQPRDRRRRPRNQRPAHPQQPPRAPHPAIGTTAELTIDNIAHGGIGVARNAEGRVVFVSDSIPGERVQARICEATNKSFWRADTVGVVEASPHRREHFWPEARLERDPEQRAGGADFGHIDLAHQRELKRLVLEDSLQRFGKIPDAQISSAAPDFDTTIRPIADDNGLGWRTRIRLQVNADGELGVFSPRTHTIVPVQDFPLATPELLQNAPFGQRFEGASSISLVHSATDQYSITIDDVPSKQPLTELAQTRVSVRASDTQADEPRPFQLAVDGFWQVHRAAPDALAEHAVQLIDPTLFDPDAHNLDLYGGVGLFAAAIADSLAPNAHIRTVEADTTATRYATTNLADLPNVEAVNADTLQFLDQQVSDASEADRSRFARGTVLLDPPRSGAGKSVVQALGRLLPRQLVYVACDPVALSRDVALLAEQGYQLARLRALDLFPNTHHFETLALFIRE